MRWSRRQAAFRQAIRLCLDAVLVGAGVACAPTPATVPTAVARPHHRKAPPAAPRVEPSPVSITVREDPGHDTWRVSYQLAKAATGVVITDRFERYRAKRWVAKTADGQVVPWTRVGGHNALVFSRPSTRFDITFGTYTTPLHRGYELNVVFADGSRLLYTGALDVAPLVCTGSGPCDREHLEPASPGPGSTSWRFETTPGREVLLPEHRASGDLDWRPATEADARTYVYFGHQEPRTDGPVWVVVDAGMPAWMKTASTTRVPEFVDYFEHRLRLSLEVRPLVLLSYNPEGNAHRTDGGGLHGLIQIGATGSGWAKETHQRRIHWLRTLAHELFHAFNGDRVQTDSSYDQWLVEGAASYFDKRALVHFGEMNQREVDSFLVDSANACATKLGGTPLLAPPVRGLYTCGPLLLSWLDAAVQHATHGHHDLADVFAGMFPEAALRRPPLYNTFDLLHHAAEITGNPLVVAPVERVLFQGAKDPATFFAKQLRRAGVVVQLKPASAIGSDARLRKQVGLVLAHCDCGGRVDFNLRQSSLDFGAEPECRAFQHGLDVGSVQGHKLGKQDGPALEAIVSRVRSKRPIHLRATSGSSVTIKGCRQVFLPATTELVLDE